MTKRYINAILYFMSGTGNSFRVTAWLSEIISKYGIAAEVKQIGLCREQDEVTHSEGQLLGILFPTHGFTAPWLVIRFALMMPRGKADAFVIAARAGTKFGKLFLPGLEGTATYLIALILVLKGYRIRGAMGIDMPSNWISVHPGFSKASADAIIARARPWAERFISRILEGGRWFGGIHCLLIGLLLIPVSMGYLMQFRFVLSKLNFANNKCNNCGICVDNCPVNAVVMWGWGKHKRPFWTYRCESCMRCMAYCPVRAIETGHSLAAILFYITNIPVSIYLLNLLSARLNLLQPFRNGFAEWVIQYVYFLVSLAISYALFSLLIRIPIFNSLFTYTTFTHIYRRYHEPDARLSDFKGG